MSYKILKGKIYFIAAVGTDLGKTFLVENLCRNILGNGHEIDVIKPIASGFCNSDLNSDSAKILQSLNKDLTKNNFDLITPWRYKDPISPHLAARKQGEKIDFERVVGFCQKKILEAQENDSFLLIESAGGVMTPINDDKTFLDLAAELEIPTILLSANYLGAISHTLCAIDVLRNRNISIEKVIVNNHLKGEYLEQGVCEDAVDMESTLFSIEKFSKIQTLPINVLID